VDWPNVGKATSEVNISIEGRMHMRYMVSIAVAICLLCDGCADPIEKLKRTAIAEFDVFRYKTMLQEDPERAKSDFEKYAGETGWKLSYGEGETVEFIKTGHSPCFFTANQTLFLEKQPPTDLLVIVNILYVYDGDIWRLIAIDSQKHQNNNFVSVYEYHIWDEPLDRK